MTMARPKLHTSTTTVPKVSPERAVANLRTQIAKGEEILACESVDYHAARAWAAVTGDVLAACPGSVARILAEFQAEPRVPLAAYAPSEELERVRRSTTKGRLALLRECVSLIEATSPDREPSAPSPAATTDEALALYEALVNLLPAQFEEVLLRMAIPIHYLPAQAAALAERATALVRFTRSQGRLADLSAAVKAARGGR